MENNFGNFTVRPARLSDADNLLRVKNDPETRHNSILAKQEIKREDHLKWLNARLGSKEVQLYVIEKWGDFIGDIRFDFYPHEAEVSVRIVAEYRGQGVASLIVSKMCDVIQKRYKRIKLMAKIVDGNLPSLMVFLKSGFQFKKHFFKVIYLERP